MIYQLVSGDCGVLAAIKPGKAFVDMSSVDIETIIDLYEVNVTVFVLKIVSLFISVFTSSYSPQLMECFNCSC
jgi:hypothetical protein